MNKEHLSIKIEMLKDEKENIKFGYSIYNGVYLAIMVFLATVTITTLNSVPSTPLKVLGLSIFFICIILMYLFFKYKIFNPRVKKLNKHAAEIKELYTKLLE